MIFQQVIDLMNSIPGFSQTYFGSTISQFVLFSLTILVFALGGKILVFFFDKHAKTFAEKTSFKFDDVIIKAIESPLFYTVLVVGLLIGKNFLTINDIGVLDFINNSIGTIILILIAWTLIRLIDGLIEFYIRPIADKTESNLDDQLIPILSKVSKILIGSFIGISILSSFGYDVTAIIAGLGIGGLAFAFAAKETIADVFGGISIFTARPFLVGDSISTSDVSGTVESVGLRFTRIRNFDKRLVTVPNAKLAASIIENISSAPQRKMTFTVGLVYDTPLPKVRKAIEIIKKIIMKHENTQDDEPLVYFDQFADSSLNITFRYYTKTNDFTKAKNTQSDVNLEIKEAFEKEKLDFAFPTQTIYLEK